MNRLKRSPTLKLEFGLIEDFDENYKALSKTHDSAQCKLLVHQLNQILNQDDYEKCKTVDESKIIGSGAFGSIYLNDDGTILKKSKTFNKLLEYMENCGNNSEKLISLLIILLEIPKTTETIKTLIDKSKIKKHFNLPYSSKLCLCDDNAMAYNIDNVIKSIPIYEYIIPFVNGKDLQKFLALSKYSYQDLVGIIVQLLYLTFYLNMNGIFHNDIHRKNILICENTETIELCGVKINDREINIDLDCKFFVVLIDFELAIIGNSSIVPVDFIQSINMLKKDPSIQKMFHENEDFKSIVTDVDQIYENYREEGYRIYEIDELNDLPLLEDTQKVASIKIFSTLIHMLHTHGIEKEHEYKHKIDFSLSDDEYKKKYMKYKQKYVDLKKYKKSMY
jgi:hypothetical protein